MEEFWINILGGIIGGLIILVVNIWVVYSVIEKSIERRAAEKLRAAQKVLAISLYRQTLAMAFSVKSIVSRVPNIRKQGRPDSPAEIVMLNDGFLVNIGWLECGVTHFHEQLALYSGSIDPEIITTLSELSTQVAGIRRATSILAYHGHEIVEKLDLYDGNENLADASGEKYTPIGPTEFIIENDQLGRPRISGVHMSSARSRNWQLFLAANIHDLIEATEKVCADVIQYAKLHGQDLSAIAERVRGETARPLEFNDLEAIQKHLFDLRQSVISKGLYLRRYVMAPEKFAI